MRELVRTNDAVLISAIEALLKGARDRAHGGRSEHERAGRLDRNFPAPHSGRRGPTRRRAGSCSRRPALPTRFAAMAAERGGRERGRHSWRPARSAPAAARAIASAMTQFCLPRRPARAAAIVLVELGAGVGAAGLAAGPPRRRSCGNVGRDRCRAGGARRARMLRATDLRNACAPSASTSQRRPRFSPRRDCRRLPRDHVLMNPPFNAAQNPSPDRGRRLAHAAAR